VNENRSFQGHVQFLEAISCDDCCSNAYFPAGTIFKRFDTNKLFVMTCQDVVERFHLCLSLLFVVAEVRDTPPPSPNFQQSIYENREN